MKRILTIQDLSCLGKCSLTIAHPLLCAMGVETAVLPTALLSTHTMFSHVESADLSGQMLPITACWQEEGITFDAIYTGYLGSEQAIQFTLEVIRRFRTPDTLIFVDPVMGDHGRLYRGLGESCVRACAALCAQADFIVPNLTEACLLTGTPYREPFSREDLRRLLLTLAQTGAACPVLTGVTQETDQIGYAGYDAREQAFFSAMFPRVPASFHGTGDIFSSVTVGGILKGLPWPRALDLAARYTALTIEAARQAGGDPRFGVCFEQTIPQLLSLLSQAISD